MAVVRSSRRKGSPRRAQVKHGGSAPDRAPLIVFALLVTLSPLAFGATDRLVQIGVLALLAVGLFLLPPEVVSLSPLGNKIVLAAGIGFLLKEFAPAALFGGTQWRTAMEALAVPLPWSHHPEPGRAIDALLALLIAALWFLWVRTLAASRPNRTWIAWSLFGAAAVVAGVSFVTHGGDPNAIYGLRYTPGWKGFGPFPNRNHTACFLAMGTLVGCGCISWAGARRQYGLMLAGIAMGLLSMAGLLATQSRGGLIGLAAGGCVFSVLVLAKLRTRRAVAVIGASCLVAVAVALAFGGPLLARFFNSAATISNQGRKLIWHDTLAMWRDAPLFGHGLESFGSLFSLYQTFPLDNQVVLHPESSWLQWLAELGIVPVAAGVVLLLWYLVRHARAAFDRHHGFFLMASGVAAAAALLAHGAVDVPAHRWGTAGFALAALALATPAIPRKVGTEEEWNVHAPALLASYRRAALVPLLVLAYWALPFLFDWPAWSPLSLVRLESRASFTTAVQTGQLAEALEWFPLDPLLHQIYAVRLLQAEPGDPEWQKQFAVADRLNPNSWSLRVTQARLCARVAPKVALAKWQDAVSRSGFRAPELLQNGVHETESLPGADDSWDRYIEQHSALALAYAALLPIDDAKDFYTLWWRERGGSPAVVPAQPEIAAFYTHAAKWATPEQVASWIQRHSDRALADDQAWAAIYHAWNDDKRAWEIVSAHRPDVAWPESTSALPQAVLEERWKRLPDNMVNARAYATKLYRNNLLPQARDVVVQATQRPHAPEWFVRKAAHMVAAEGNLKAAVEIMLRDQPLQKAGTGEPAAPEIAGPE